MAVVSDVALSLFLHSKTRCVKEVDNGSHEKAETLIIFMTAHSSE